jgi:polyisoprenoid-binding protein YceI
MKTTLLFLLSGALGLAAPSSYQLRPGQGAILELTVEKTGFLNGKKHVFNFPRYQGTLLFDPDAPEKAAITLGIESASLSCHDAWLSAKDLKKVQDYALKDMLAVDRFPRITFRSTTIRKIDIDRYEASGSLTIRDVSSPVVVTVVLRTGPAGSLVLEGASSILLTAFGLKPPTAALGTIGTRNEMAFRFVVVATHTE